MAGVMVSVAAGVMNSVIGKLTTLLSEEYNLASGVKPGIRFMRDELSSMNAALQRLAGMDDDQIDVQTKEWRNKVRELSYDIEDCVDRFMLLHSSEKAKKNFVQRMLGKIKELWEGQQIAKEIQELKARVVEEKERHDRYQYIDASLESVVSLDPRAPTLYEEVRDLVGIDGPREEIIGWLKGEDRQLKVVSIFGTGGQGKTTLAMEVYRKIEEPFDCRASVTVSRTPDVKKLLRDILFQINKNAYYQSEGWEMEQLIPTLKEHLRDKRYLIVIDDIWSVLAWEHVKFALPANDNGSGIITTTRIKDVAQSCCSGCDCDGHMYEAKPLSEDDSRRLFFRRIFCSSEDCPQELMEVANDILRKCGGLPLAIISMAGLLANKRRAVDVWVKIQKSVSSAVEKDSPIDKMKRILFLSYFDLPYYLKSCLLYLSVVPEDSRINSRDLIWIWAAEGLIPGQNRESMEQLGESYLHELINRSMIQAIKIVADGTVKICRVHDVVLDFIISQAVEDNFATILNGNDVPGNYGNKIRRLSVQSNIFEAAENLPYLRSLHIFGYDVLENLVPRLLSSHVLRVLCIHGDSNSRDSHAGPHINIKQLPEQLKYLRINSPDVIKLPEQIGNLQHLEILDVRSSRATLEELPESIVQLKKLVRLFVPPYVRLPDGIGNLQDLEELSEINLSRASIKGIQGLGELTKLKALDIYWPDSVERAYAEGQKKKACLSSLSKLVTCSLQSLRYEGLCDSDFINHCIVSCDSTTPLRRLIFGWNMLITIPCRMGSLVNLARVRIQVRSEVREEGFKILASLPKLLSLTVFFKDDSAVCPIAFIGRQGFQSLVKFRFHCLDEAALTFEPGAMPKLQSLKLTLMARCQFTSVVGLQNLSSLKHITVFINCYETAAEKVEALEDDIRGAAGSHPNRPILELRRLLETDVQHSLLDNASGR